MYILSAGSLDSFMKLISVLLIFVFVLVITYLTTYWMSGVQKKRTYNKNLKVIETISVGNNKFISIVEAGTAYLVVSIGKEDVNLLARLSKDELSDLSFENNSNATAGNDNFQDILNKIKDKMPKSRDIDE